MPPGSTEYDLVRYPSYTHAQTHPDRLAVIGTLLGLTPAPVNNCRVLELGCADASNLAPMAWGLPGSQFLGVDLASNAIASGLEMIAELGLSNIRLVQADVTKVEHWGEFDYIIAHGLFSWVPKEARDRILQTCRQSLAPHGIAFVSYNAFPGAHLRQMLSEMMLFHVRGFQSPEERVSQAMALVRFLAKGHNNQDVYRAWLQTELETALAHEEGHLYHDELAAVNQPFYFTQFVERASAHQLQYLAEADYFEMFDHGFSEEAREALAQLGRNRILREQYLDFLKCRRFRQTLLCRGERELRLEADTEKIAGLLISSMAQCAAAHADLRPGVKQVYQTAKNARCETDSALGKATLEVLGGLWPTPLPFDRLFDEAAARLGKAGLGSAAEEGGRERLRGFLAGLYSAGMVEFRSIMPEIVQRPSERPRASPVARWQAQRGKMLTTAFHLSVQVEDEVGRNVLMWLDGTLDRGQLLDRLWRWLRAKDALILAEGDEAPTRNKIAGDLDKNLAKLARLGLLVG